LVTTVDELINPIDGTWDEDLLRSIFLPIDVQNILQIPLLPGREDLVAWHFNRSGLFSVRSAYHCEWTSKFETEPTVVDKRIRENLWKHSIPGKIKIFGWRLINEFIPCKGVLFNRHIGENSDCPMCLSEAEDIRHMMFMCDRAKSLWNSLGVWQQIAKLSQGNRSGQQMIQEVIKVGRKVLVLSNVGLAELVLTGGRYI
jgi:hypothetical protein